VTDPSRILHTHCHRFVCFLAMVDQLFTRMAQYQRRDGGLALQHLLARGCALQFDGESEKEGDRKT